MKTDEIKEKRKKENKKIYEKLEYLFDPRWNPGTTYEKIHFTLISKVLTELCRKHLNGKFTAKFWIDGVRSPNQLDFELVGKPQGCQADTVKILREYFLGGGESTFLKISSGDTKIVHILLETDLSQRVKTIRNCIEYFDQKIQEMNLESLKKQKKYSPEVETATNTNKFAYQEYYDTYIEEIWESTASNIKDKPLSKKNIPKEQSIYKYPRNASYAKKSIQEANYTCEINQNHETFIKKLHDTKYVEAHHLIPLKYYNRFNVSLDVPANIICLCPSCHRKLHYGQLELIRVWIKSLFKERKKRLEKCGIKISSEQFLELYK